MAAAALAGDRTILVRYLDPSPSSSTPAGERSDLQ